MNPAMRHAQKIRDYYMRSPGRMGGSARPVPPVNPRDRQMSLDFGAAHDPAALRAAQSARMRNMSQQAQQRRADLPPLSGRQGPSQRVGYMPGQQQMELDLQAPAVQPSMWQRMMNKARGPEGQGAVGRTSGGVGTNTAQSQAPQPKPGLTARYPITTGLVSGSLGTAATNALMGGEEGPDPVMEAFAASPNYAGFADELMAMGMDPNEVMDERMYNRIMRDPRAAASFVMGISPEGM